MFSWVETSYHVNTYLFLGSFMLNLNPLWKGCKQNPFLIWWERNNHEYLWCKSALYLVKRHSNNSLPLTLVFQHPESGKLTRKYAWPNTRTLGTKKPNENLNYLHAFTSCTTRMPGCRHDERKLMPSWNCTWWKTTKQVRVWLPWYYVVSP